MKEKIEWPFAGASVGQSKLGADVCGLISVLGFSIFRDRQPKDELKFLDSIDPGQAERRTHRMANGKIFIWVNGEASQLYIN